MRLGATCLAGRAKKAWEVLIAGIKHARMLLALQCVMQMAAKSTSLVLIGLIATSSCSANSSLAKSAFNKAVENCVNETQLGDGHTHQDITNCVSKSNAVCGEPGEFQTPFGERHSYDFAKTSFLRCVKNNGIMHEVCDTSTWYYVVESRADSAESSSGEITAYDINCFNVQGR